MKKFVCMLLSLCLVAGAALAQETGEQLLEELKGQTLMLSSGVGAWDTSLIMGDNGTFTGEFHDSEMGDTGENYPGGTVYVCRFHGQFSQPVREAEGVWTLQLSQLELDEGQQPELIEDGIRFVLAAPYGLENAKQVTLYQPGVPVDILPEEFLPWSHLTEIDPDAKELPYYALWNPVDESGFIGDLVEESGLVGLANPWRDVTADGLMEAAGLTFGIPEGAEDVGYSVMNENELAEMRFTLQGGQFTARIAPASAFTDISGMYYAWEAKEGFQLGACVGSHWAAQDGEINLYLWYDAAPGLMYSLSAQGANLQQIDLQAVARQVYIPTMTDN